MQYALLIYETAERFANRTLDKGDAYIGAWRAYHQMLVEAGIYVGGQPLRGTSASTTAGATSRTGRTRRPRSSSAAS